jgi:hypothetical protein
VKSANSPKRVPPRSATLGTTKNKIDKAFGHSRCLYVGVEFVPSGGERHQLPGEPGRRVGARVEAFRGYRQIRGYRDADRRGLR